MCVFSMYTHVQTNVSVYALGSACLRILMHVYVHVCASKHTYVRLGSMCLTPQCMCMHVCMRTRMHVQIYVYMYYTYACIHAFACSSCLYVHAFVYTCVIYRNACTCARMFVHTCTRICTHELAETNAHACARTNYTISPHTSTYTYIYIYIYIYTYIHAHVLLLLHS
jgi:hypothetical protein